jgi:hypothetical protein
MKRKRIENQGPTNNVVKISDAKGFKPKAKKAVFDDDDQEDPRPSPALMLRLAKKLRRAKTIVRLYLTGYCQAEFADKLGMEFMPEKQFDRYMTGEGVERCIKFLVTRRIEQMDAFRDQPAKRLGTVEQWARREYSFLMGGSRSENDEWIDYLCGFHQSFDFKEKDELKFLLSAVIGHTYYPLCDCTIEGEPRCSNPSGGYCDTYSETDRYDAVVQHYFLARAAFGWGNYKHRVYQATGELIGSDHPWIKDPLAFVQ